MSGERSLSIKLLLLFLLMLVAFNGEAAKKNNPGPIQFSSVVDPDFGLLMGGPAGRDFILTTSGTISGADAADYISGAVAGMVNIVADNNSSLDILATNFTADGGVVIVNVTCIYGTGSDMDCDQGFTAVGRKGQGEDMYIGLEINTTQVHVDNDTAAPGFDIVINYI